VSADVASKDVALEVEKVEIAVDSDVGEATVVDVISAIVNAVVVPITVANVDVVVAVAATVVVPVIGGFAALEVVTGRLEQKHREGLVEQS
jgi:hypothetical protein